MNLFLSLLTQPAPWANYRGENEQNRAVLQKIVIGDDEFPVISPEAIRNALRDMLAAYGLRSNRRRERNEEQLAVSFADYPDPTKYVDDFLFGYLVVNREQIPESRRAGFQYKRDSILRNNLAVGLSPYRQESLFTQSPQTVNRDEPEQKPNWSNADSSQLLHREMIFTAYQYPLALNLDECMLDPAAPDRVHNLWFSSLLRALSELSGVAGNHTRSYFDMAPVSAIARLTGRMAAGFPLYPFAADGGADALIDSIIEGHRPGTGFHIAGELARALTTQKLETLRAKGVATYSTTDALFNALSQSLCGRSMPTLETAC